MLSRRKQPTLRDATIVSPRNDVWETSAEIPYWWRVTTQIWLVLLIGSAEWEIYDYGRAIGKIKQNELDCHDTTLLTYDGTLICQTAIFGSTIIGVLWMLLRY